VAKVSAGNGSRTSDVTSFSRAPRNARGGAVSSHLAKDFFHCAERGSEALRDIVDESTVQRCALDYARRFA
jgi:hypothetical protein